ncbi:Hypothetical Protein CTN_0086 [Thermotoga neapolitana DSM 4359]|uniref:Uncharacterized protein n=1 Tax=Thermotoga neapolitana (strain ATCC 49049 / DSM 4359 / NBRC 107923 / NS-E) TaxID=309803 RepID=B9KB66_THENN|nr:Hypothetical Protein CTN_0086 [Thermotoga neapolitana DSM 4359]
MNVFQKGYTSKEVLKPKSWFTSRMPVDCFHTSKEVLKRAVIGFFLRKKLFGFHTSKEVLKPKETFPNHSPNQKFPYL